MIVHKETKFSPKHFIVQKIFSFLFSSISRHTRFSRDWSSDVCSSDLAGPRAGGSQREGPASPSHARGGNGRDCGSPGQRPARKRARRATAVYERDPAALHA